MCSAPGDTALGVWSPSVPPLQVSARRAYYVQTLTGGAELSESDAAKLDKCFEAGADYVHASPAELAGRLAKNGSASSKRGRELLNTRIAAMNKRQKAAASGRLGPAFVKAHEQAAEDAALRAHEAAEGRRPNAAGRLGTKSHVLCVAVKEMITEWRFALDRPRG